MAHLTGENDGGTIGRLDPHQHRKGNGAATTLILVNDGSRAAAFNVTDVFH